MSPSDGHQMSSDDGMSEDTDCHDQGSGGSCSECLKHGVGSWRLYTTSFQDLKTILFTVTNPCSKVASSNLFSEFICSCFLQMRL